MVDLWSGRSEFCTGFQKRKNQRRKEAAEQIEARAKLALVEARKTVCGPGVNDESLHFN